MSSDNTRQNDNTDDSSVSPVDVAEEFVKRYYKDLFTQQQDIQNLYKDDSVFTSLTENASTEITNERVLGKNNIGNALRGLNLASHKVRLPIFQAQESVDGCILILAKGRFFKKGSQDRPFAQTFLLAPASGGWYVKNDILIFLDQQTASATQSEASEASPASTPASQPATTAGGLLSSVVNAVVSSVSSVLPGTTAEASTTEQPATTQAASGSQSTSSNQTKQSSSNSNTQQNTSAPSSNSAQGSAQNPERRDSPMPTNSRTRPSSNPLSQQNNNNNNQSQNQSQNQNQTQSQQPNRNKGKEKLDDSPVQNKQQNNNNSNQNQNQRQNNNNNNQNQNQGSKPSGKLSYASIVGQAATAQAAPRPAQAAAPKTTVTSTLKVRDISFSTTAERLREKFTTYGEITDLKHFKGYAYIEYKDPESIKKAIAASTEDPGSMMLDDRTLVLEEKERQPAKRGVTIDGRRVENYRTNKDGRPAGRGDRDNNNRGGFDNNRGDRENNNRGGGRGKFNREENSSRAEGRQREQQELNNSRADRDNNRGDRDNNNRGGEGQEHRNEHRGRGRGGFDNNNRGGGRGNRNYDNNRGDNSEHRGRGRGRNNNRDDNRNNNENRNNNRGDNNNSGNNNNNNADNKPVESWV